jgi:hypothetical protein
MKNQVNNSKLLNNLSTVRIWYSLIDFSIYKWWILKYKTTDKFLFQINRKKQKKWLKFDAFKPSISAKYYQ